MTSASLKRARSPEPISPRLLERPLKRPIILNNSSCADFSLYPPGSAPDTPNTEDWVSQAGYLSIDSPFVVETTSECGQPEEDASMEDSSQDVWCGASSLQDNSVHIANTQPSTLCLGTGQSHLRNSNAFLADSLQLPSSSSDNLCAKSSPSIATQDCREAATAEPSTFATSLESSLPRKPRFALGPRGDCEMCRRGVKGHSAHWS